jgi:NADPH2:quinone reductase
MGSESRGERVVVTELGETPLDAIENHLKLEPQRRPDQRKLSSKDVVIAIKSAAVGWVDLLMTSGQYQHMLTPPYCPGLEYSGEVLWTGDDVSHVSVGDAVIADPFLTGPRSLGAHQQWGGFASYAVAPSEAVLPLPAPLSFDQGCHLLSGYETAYHCLIHRGKLQEGETVLIHGASGTTGLAAVHVAKLVGATVIATGRSPEKLSVVESQGADHVLCTSDEGGGLRSFRDDVKAITKGTGVDVVYDGVGGDISRESLRCTHFGSRYLIAGWAATPFVAKGKGERGAPNANVLPTNLIMMKGLDVLGCPAAIAAHRDPAMRDRRRARVLQWTKEGRIVPHVSQAFPMSEYKSAMRAKWESRFVGGVALHPED